MRTAYITELHHPPRTCPTCHACLSVATGVSLDEEPPPELEGIGDPPEGGLTMCGRCGVVLIFEGGGFRLATAEEWAALDERLRALLGHLTAERARWRTS